MVSMRTNQVEEGNSTHVMPVQLTIHVIGSRKTTLFLDFKTPHVTMKINNEEVLMSSVEDVPLEIEGTGLLAYVTKEALMVIQGEEFQIRVFPGGTVMIKLSNKYFSKVICHAVTCCSTH